MPPISALHGVRAFLSIASLLVFAAAADTSQAAEDDESQAAYVTVTGDGLDFDGSLAQTAPTTRAPARSTPRRQPSTPPSRDNARTQGTSETPLSAEQTLPPSSLLASLFGSQTEYRGAERLAGTPNMFGDFFNNVGGSVLAVVGFDNAMADLPLAAGSRRAKIAEDDNALPQDRVFFLYNHFQDALHARSNLGGVGPFERQFSVDRYTLGIEKTLLNNVWSVEVRMPLAGQTDFNTPFFAVSGGDVGNLAVIVKRLIYSSESTAASIGLGIDTPTGSDVSGFATAPPPISKTAFFSVRNDAVHLLPYAGIVRAPTDRFFWEGFVQVDIATNGNQVSYQNNAGPGTGQLSEQNLLYLDLATGYWLYRNPCACWITGLAGMVELHYTTTLQDATLVQIPSPPLPAVGFSNFSNRVDILNLTVGIHTELTNHTICRVGAVLPLRANDDRSFNSELQVQLERRF
jgi:hypothetical protein